MAFMALFGWVFLPIILIGLFVWTIQNALLWALAHTFLIDLAVGGLLILNLLLLISLLRRRRQNQNVLLLLAAVWEGGVVVLCALYLVIQPLRFLPEDFGVPFDVENVCFDEWEIVSCQGVPAGYTRTQEEIDQYLGTRITYAEDHFISDGRTYGLKSGTPYNERVVWREERLNIPGSVLSASFEGLGLTNRKLRRAIVNFQKEPEERPIGWIFYLLDRDTLMVYYDCIFFLAERVE